MLIRAIKSQLNLKPYFYKQASIVGGAGCILGFIAVYPVFFIIAGFFGIDANTPIRSYDGSTVLLMFIVCIVAMCAFLYSFCSLCAFLFYGVKYKKGVITKGELFDIALKGLYPKRWQRELV